MIFSNWEVLGSIAKLRHHHARHVLSEMKMVRMQKLVLKKVFKLSSLGMLIGLDFSWPVPPGSPWNPFCQATASSWCV